MIPGQWVGGENTRKVREDPGKRGSEERRQPATLLRGLIQFHYVSSLSLDSESWQRLCPPLSVCLSVFRFHRIQNDIRWKRIVQITFEALSSRQPNANACCTESGRVPTERSRVVRSLLPKLCAALSRCIDSSDGNDDVAIFSFLNSGAMRWWFPRKLWWEWDSIPTPRNSAANPLAVVGCCAGWLAGSRESDRLTCTIEAATIDVVYSLVDSLAFPATKGLNDKSRKPPGSPTGFRCQFLLEPRPSR